MKAFRKSFGVLLLLVGSQVMAATHEVQLGWANIVPCSKVEWNNNGIFGTPAPTLRTAEQRVYAIAVVNAPDASGIQRDVTDCALQGAAAAGLSSIIASPAAAVPSFKAGFAACMSARASDWTGFSLRVTSSCMW